MDISQYIILATMHKWVRVSVDRVSKIVIRMLSTYLVCQWQEALMSALVNALINSADNWKLGQHETTQMGLKLAPFPGACVIPCLGSVSCQTI